MIRILAFGGLGFIGANFIRWSICQGKEFQFKIADLKTYASDPSRLPKDFSEEVREANLLEVEKYEDLVEWCDVVINFAAETHNDRSLDSPMLFVESNVMGPAALFSVCSKFGKPVIQISTDEVYGDFDFTSTELATELSPLRPSSPYSSSKASAEMIALAWRRSFDLSVTITNCSNNFGPGQHAEKLIPNVIDRVRTGRPVVLFGTGENIRDWIHVDDHSSAISLIIEKKLWGKKINISANNEWSNIRLVRRILEELDEKNHPIQFISDRPGHDRRYGLDASKLRALGWRPIVTGSAKFSG